MAEQVKNPDEIRERVREGYAAAAKAAEAGADAGCGGEGSTCGCSGDPVGVEHPPGHRQGSSDFGAELYSDAERGELPEAAKLASLGCGNPTAVAELHAGEDVLDLGSGGGIDVLLSAQRVGSSGKAYGLDMTDEMLDLARANQERAGVDNVEWLRGTIEKVPLADDSVDVVISNCVINLSADKPSVLREAARVLRPGGRLAFTDIVADEEMDDATRNDMAQWTGCIAGALTTVNFERELAAAGFAEIEVRETHRVHEHAGSAIIRARLPAAPEPATARSTL